jgi:hypothetical protein
MTRSRCSCVHLTYRAGQMRCPEFVFLRPLCNSSIVALHSSLRRVPTWTIVQARWRDSATASMSSFSLSYSSSNSSSASVQSLSSSQPLHMQRLQSGLLPSTIDRPKTAFSFSALNDFTRDNLECGTSTSNYYGKLRRITPNIFPHLVPVSAPAAFLFLP